MEKSKWIRIKATTGVEHLDELCSVMSMVTNSLMIEDYSDSESLLNGVYGDLIDEELLKKDKTVCSVSVFVPDDAPVTDHVAYIKERLSALGFDASIEIDGVCEEDWADSWKQYYKPIKAGERLVIVPVWEKYDSAEGEVVVLMDPGMAFGTGTHETTRLCAALLEKYVTPGCSMLDVGCGSGILAICASKLGAQECFACDIDPMSVKIARENCERNGTANVVCEKSDLLSAVTPPEGGYDVCTANIVADIIIRMSPDIGAYLAQDGVLIVSGIITERQGEVVDALDKYGFEVIDDLTENGWYCAALGKRK